jgi:hypothetical protein
VQNFIAKILQASFLISKSAMNLHICLLFCKRVNITRVSSRRLQFSYFKNRQRKWYPRVMINCLKAWFSPAMIRLLKVRLWLLSHEVLLRVHLIYMRCKVKSEWDYLMQNLIRSKWRQRNLWAQQILPMISFTIITTKFKIFCQSLFLWRHLNT